MAYETLLVERRGDTIEVTLNRPDKMNAANLAMLSELRAVIEGEAPTARALLLKGNERAFCAGADLTDSTFAGDADAGDILDTYYHPVIRGLAALPVPVVAAVEGVAAGAGCNLALAADIVIAGRSSRFDEAFVRIGLVPDAGGTHRLPRLVGDARARGMMMLGEPIDGATAADWGLIWKAVGDTEVVAEARAIAARLAAGPTKALGLIKQTLLAGEGAGLDDQLEIERGAQTAASRTADFTEGVAAFREKRAPVFRGR